MKRQARTVFFIGIVALVSTVEYLHLKKGNRVTVNADVSKNSAVFVAQARTRDVENLMNLKPSPTTNYTHSTNTKLPPITLKEADGRKYERLLTPCPAAKVGNGPVSKEWNNFKERLEQYATFHQEQIQKIKSGNSQVRTISYVCKDNANCFGIGDQFYRIQQILLLAVASDRVLLLDWGEKSMRSFTYLLPNRVEWSVKLDNRTLQQSPIVKRLKDREDYVLFMKRIRSNESHVRTSKALPVPFMPGINRLLRIDSSLFEKLSLDKILESTPPDTFSGELLRYLFTLSQEVLRRVENAQKLIGLFNRPYIGVHIRTGFVGTKYEEVGDFNLHKILRTDSNWLSTIECSLHLSSDTSQLPDSRMPLYLATDSYQVKEVAARRQDQRIKTLNMTLQHVAIHPATELSKDENEPANDSLLQVDGNMATWIDFLLLARADILVHSTSGFSTVAGQYCSVRRHYFVPNCTHKPLHP